MNKLTKSDVLWIFAVKNKREQEHYDKYYGEYVNQPTDNTLYIITSNIVEKTNGWAKVVRIMEANKHLHRMIKEKNVAKELGRPLDYKTDKIEPCLEEWLWYGVAYFFKFMTRDFLNKHAPKKWEQWVDEEREYWDSNKED